MDVDQLDDRFGRHRGDVIAEKELDLRLELLDVDGLLVADPDRLPQIREAPAERVAADRTRRPNFSNGSGRDTIP